MEISFSGCFNRSSATIASPTHLSHHGSANKSRFQSLKRDNCLSNPSHTPRAVSEMHGVSIAQARQLPLQPTQRSPTLSSTRSSFNRSSATIASPTAIIQSSDLHIALMFQSLKRDNCLSNLIKGIAGFLSGIVFQSLKRDNCLSNAAIAATIATRAPFQSLKRDNCLSNSASVIVGALQERFQSLKRDNCLSNVDNSYGGGASTRFQSLKRDNCLSNHRKRGELSGKGGVSIAQARQLPLQRMGL